jgi:hypothetical protein
MFRVEQMIKQAANEDHLAFVAELAGYLRDARNRPGVSAEERGRNERWLEHAVSLKALFEMGAPKTARSLELSAQADLPPALLKELSPKRSDQLERQIIAVLAACNGSADLDEILIGLYRGFHVIGKRRVIQNKLWRLVRTGRIAKAKDKRNVFALNVEEGGDRRRKTKGARSLARRTAPTRRRKLERRRE